MKFSSIFTYLLRFSRIIIFYLLIAPQYIPKQRPTHRVNMLLFNFCGELEVEISELDVAIEQEKLHSYTYLSVEMIEKFLYNATFGDIQEVSVRKSIVNTFIREVIYYPDKIIITLNFTDTYDKPEVTTELVQISKSSLKPRLLFKPLSVHTSSLPSP